VPERGLPAGALILLGLILVGGAYIGWYRLSGEGKLPAESVAPVPARLASLVEQAVPGPDGRIPVPAPPPPAPRRTEDNGEFEPRHAAAENPLLLPEPLPPAPAPIEEMRTTSIPGATATTAIAMPVPPPMRQPEPVPSQLAAPVPADPANPDGERVLLRFTGDTWVQIRERGGLALVTKVMKAGDTFPVPTRANLVLNTGNAGRVEIMVDGALVPSIGGQGTVRKDVPLDPDLLKIGPVTAVPGRR
jgi:cytoskeleton protein RodZ